MTKLNTGDLFPDFEVIETEKGETTIHEIMNGRKTMFIFLRYIGCTVCRYDVHQLMLNYSRFHDLNVEVCVIMQSERETVKNDLKDILLPFPLICDPQQSLYKELEINPASSMQELVGEDGAALQTKAQNAKNAGFTHGIYEGNEQQLPAFFYVDENRNVLHAHYGRTIMDMPDVEAMLEMV